MKQQQQEQEQEQQQQETCASSFATPQMARAASEHRDFYWGCRI